MVEIQLRLWQPTQWYILISGTQNLPNFILIPQTVLAWAKKQSYEVIWPPSMLWNGIIFMSIKDSHFSSLLYQNRSMHDHDEQSSWLMRARRNCSSNSPASFCRKMYIPTLIEKIVWKIYILIFYFDFVIDFSYCLPSFLDFLERWLLAWTITQWTETWCIVIRNILNLGKSCQDPAMVITLKTSRYVRTCNLSQFESISRYIESPHCRVTVAYRYKVES